MANILKKCRLELGLLQREVADRIGVTLDTILNWERNRCKPRLRYIPKVIEFLGYNPVLSEPKILGERVLEYRKIHGINQKKMAEMIGIEPTTLSRVERGKVMFRQSILKKVSNFIGD